MNQKPLWLWKLTSAHGQCEGAIRGVDPRDALTRMLTYVAINEHQFLGEKHGIPVDVIDQAPGNGDRTFHAKGDGWSIDLKMVTCPTSARGPDDVIGCGSNQLTDPDEEGWVDCCDCGIFFNPNTEH